MGQPKTRNALANAGKGHRRMTEAHIRIDEGIRRPKYKHKPPKSPKADLGTWIIPKDLDPHEVIERYMTEATTSQIAGQYGLSRKALTRWLRELVPDKWKQAQILRALCRKEDADEGMINACDALSLARARESLRSAQFDLQALDKDYHPKSDLVVSIVPILSITVAPHPAQQVIDLPADAVQQLDKPKP